MPTVVERPLLKESDKIYLYGRIKGVPSKFKQKYMNLLYMEIILYQVNIIRENKFFFIK